MKFIQLTGSMVASGVTAYMNEMKQALLKEGHEVETYFCKANKKEEANAPILTPGIKKFNYTQEELDHINSCDYVLVHSLMGATYKEYANDFNELLQYKIKTKKVLFLNAHYKRHYAFFGINLFENKDFINSFDYICNFSPNSEISNFLKETIGKVAFDNKYINLYHPISFDERLKKLWLPLNEKKKRVTYIGRYTSFKKPWQILNMCKYDTNHEFEYEMRGIEKMIGVVAVPDLFYTIDTSKKYSSLKESIKGDSKYTTYISSKWRTENNISEDDLMIDYPRTDNKMLIFGPYKHEDGMKAMRASMFGLECHSPKKLSVYRDEKTLLPGVLFEYAMAEIVMCGSIPVFDSTIGNKGYVIDEDTKQSKSLKEMKLGLFLNEDDSNMGDILDEMKELSNNEKAYNNMRERLWKYYKDYTDPVKVIRYFVKQLTSERKKANLF